MFFVVGGVSQAMSKWIEGESDRGFFSVREGGGLEGKRDTVW